MAEPTDDGKKAAGRTVRDREIVAMHDIAEIMDPLSAAEAERVRTWIHMRFGPKPGAGYGPGIDPRD